MQCTAVYICPSQHPCPWTLPSHSKAGERSEVPSETPVETFLHRRIIEQAEYDPAVVGARDRIPVLAIFRSILDVLLAYTELENFRKL